MKDRAAIKTEEKKMGLKTQNKKEKGLKERLVGRICLVVKAE